MFSSSSEDREGRKMHGREACQRHVRSSCCEMGAKAGNPILRRLDRLPTRQLSPWRQDGISDSAKRKITYSGKTNLERCQKICNSSSNASSEFTAPAPCFKFSQFLMDEAPLEPTPRVVDHRG
jgi:hypothetical protein